MADNNQTTQVDPPKAQGGSFSWSASEYIDHRQGFGWYATLALISAALAAGLYLLTKDYFATGTVIILGVIVGSFAARTPQQLDYELSSQGVKIGDKLRPYRVFKSFSIAQEGNLTSIGLIPVKRLMPQISIFFDPADEDEITDILGEHLPLEEHQVDNIERLARRLRF